MGLRELSIPILSAAVALSLSCDSATPRAPAPPGVTEAHRELAELLQNTRPFQPRLALFDRWSPCGPAKAGTVGIPLTECHAGPANPRLASEALRRLRQIGSRIQLDAARRGDAAALHALGVWWLLQPGRAEAFDAAVARLEQAVGLEPANASLRSDLAAAYYLRAMRLQRPDDLVRCLAACDVVLRAEPGHAPALFNRALALQALYQQRAAIAAWRAFLGAAGDSPWSADAAAALASLEGAAVPLGAAARPAGPGSTQREIAAAVAAEPVDSLVSGERLLASSGAAWSADGPVAQKLRWLAEALASRSSDAMLQDELAAWAAAEAPANNAAARARRSHLATGYVQYMEGLRLYRQLRLQPAEAAFTAAGRDLHAGGSPLRAWAVYYTAVCRFWAGDLAAAESFSRLDAAPEMARYALLRGHIAWMRGLIEVDGGEFDLALRHYQEAITTFLHAGADGEAGFVRVLLAQTFRMVNDPRSAWEQLYQALAMADRWSQEKWRQNLFDEVADHVRDLGEPEAALYFQQRAVASAIASSQEVVICEALAQRAQAFHRFGRDAAADADVADARRHLDRISDPLARQHTALSVQLSEAAIASTRRPRQALALLDRALRDSEQRKITAVLPEIQLERARLLLRMQREVNAEGALTDAIQILERSSHTLTAGSRRSALLARNRDIFNQMIRLQLDVRRDPLMALAYVERARISEFLPGAGDESSRLDGGALRTLQSKLPADSAVVIFRVLDDRILCWVIRQREWELREQPVSAPELAQLIDGFRASLQHPLGSAGASVWERHLQKLLLDPMTDRLEGVKRLWVLPDGPLFRLPLRALHDPSTHRYLGQRFEVAVALTLGLGSPAPHRPPDARDSSAAARLLVVADPAFDPNRFPHLARLGAAGAEVAAATGAFLDSAVLAGPDATQQRFLTALPDRDIVHFAGHAIPNREAPDLSLLVFAPSPGNPGVLYAKDIEKLRLNRASLVVLAACDTGGDGEATAGGFAGLARPFLAARARAVIGSLWQVDDRESARLFADFYRRLQQNRLNPAAALQQVSGTELADPASQNPGSTTWAAYEVYVMSPDRDRSN